MFGILGYIKSRFDKDRDFIENIRLIVGFYPQSVHLFKQAFTHKSKTSIENYESNERLEFLGDALLSTIVGEYLYFKYPMKDEGFLTKMRAKIVKRATLNHVAYEWGIRDILEQMNIPQISDSMLGNALEALIGAIYIEKGYNYTKELITHKILLEVLDIHELEEINENFKSLLLEWCQKNHKNLSYPVIAKYRENKKDKFKIGVAIDKEIITEAEGYNKKSAEQEASKKGLLKLGLLEIEV